MKSKIITNKMYLSLMFPFIFSTITQPLLGAVDIAVIGRLVNENYISGIAIGALIFNTLYWMFGFLKFHGNLLFQNLEIMAFGLH